MDNCANNANCVIWWSNLEPMQVAFYLAGEITQVLDTIPWVRCASGNVSFRNLYDSSLKKGASATDRDEMSAGMVYSSKLIRVCSGNQCKCAANSLPSHCWWTVYTTENTLHALQSLLGNSQSKQVRRILQKTLSNIASKTESMNIQYCNGKHKFAPKSTKVNLSP